MSLKEILESLTDKTKDSVLIIDRGVANVLSKLYSIEKVYEIYKIKQIISLPLSSRNRNLLLSKSLKICILLSSFLWDHWEEIRSILNNLTSDTPTFSLKIHIFCAISQDIHNSIKTDFCPGNTTPYE